MYSPYLAVNIYHREITMHGWEGRVSVIRQSVGSMMRGIYLWGNNRLISIELKCMRVYTKFTGPNYVLKLYLSSVGPSPIPNFDVGH